MRYIQLLFLALFTVFLSACPAGESEQEAEPVEATAPPAVETPVLDEENPLAQAMKEALAVPAAGDEEEAKRAAPPKQLILIYTGHTLSRPDTLREFVPAEGGLSALTASILDYEAQITDFNRRRVLNEGGNADEIRTDLERGFLGDHPFMLFDYGGWSRQNDFLGDIYVALYLRMFSALKYTGVGCLRFTRLPPERWEAYRQQAPEDFKLLVSAGQPQGETIPVVNLITREVHGGLWGAAALPIPPKEDDPQAALEEYIEQAAALLDGAGCKFRILLFADGLPSLYDRLAKDTRFDVVIGVPPPRGVPDGYGEMPSGGALLLPSLSANGREFGVCHLYYTESGDRPVQYYYSRKPCYDDLHSPLPFRNQVAEAVAEHQVRYQEWAATQQQEK